MKQEQKDRQVEIVSFLSDKLVLKGLLLRPQGSEPFPTVLFNHGAARSYDAVMTTLGSFFSERGYVFFMPYRRGYGLSSDQAPYLNDILDEVAERSGISERGQVLVRQLEGPHLTDQLAALTWCRQQPFIDPERIFVIGSSLGGIQALLIASKTRQIKAVVSFAVAALSWANAPELRLSLLNAARAVKVPIMLIQAENDADTTPSQALSAALADANKLHRLKLFPKFGETTTDGHNFGYFGSKVWGPEVLAFFDEQMS